MQTIFDDYMSTFVTGKPVLERKLDQYWEEQRAESEIDERYNEIDESEEEDEKSGKYNLNF